MSPDEPSIQVDNTLIQPLSGKQTERSAVEITYPLAEGFTQFAQFTGSFLIGRGQTCKVRIMDGQVSRLHAQVYYQDGRWWVRDAQSQNGVYCNGKRIQQMLLEGKTTLELGRRGPTIQLDIRQPCRSSAYVSPASEAGPIARYIDPDYRGPMGARTAEVRLGIQQYIERQSRHYAEMIKAILDSKHPGPKVGTVEGEADTERPQGKGALQFAPGILKAVAALITAVGGVIVALYQAGFLHH